MITIRDTAVSVMMTEEQATKFYASLDAQIPIPRLDPDRVWEQWQEIRDKVEWPTDG